MDYIFREQLSDLIDLKEIKIVDTCNKKVISTSIFIPEDPMLVVKPLAILQTLLKVWKLLVILVLRVGFTEFTLMTCFSVEYLKKNLSQL